MRLDVDGAVVLPHDERGFVHRKIFAVAKSAFETFTPVGRIISAARGRAKQLPSQVRVAPAARPAAGFTGCGQGRVIDPRTGQCVSRGAVEIALPQMQFAGTPQPGVIAALQRAIPGGATGRTGFGDAIMGRYGVALEPGSMPSSRLVCPRGTVLGHDNLCYNKRDLRKGERKWQPGRKPLMTGGDLNAITKASKAARRLQSQAARLQKMGMLPKSAPPRRKKKVPQIPTIAVSARAD